MNGSWVQKAFALILVAFCVEVGLVLIIFPWTERWNTNLIPTYVPALRSFWLSAYWRGAVSGLGLLDVWIGLTEIFRLRRFSAPQPKPPAGDTPAPSAN